MSSTSIPGISQIINNYDNFIIDLWGVVHDGSALYPAALKTIQELSKANKNIIFLSNAPRRKEAVAMRLKQLGIEPGSYYDIVSSGELLFRDITKLIPTNQKYYYIGGEQDQNLLDGHNYNKVTNINEANFILCTDLEHEQLDISDKLKDDLKIALKNDLILLCANPDIYIVKQSGGRFFCAGYIGDYYQQMGGQIINFGKPYSDGYKLCLELFGTDSKDRTIAIGDSFHTDITGAFNYGIHSILIRGGIHNDELTNPTGLEKLIKQYGVHPTYHIDYFKY